MSAGPDQPNRAVTPELRRALARALLQAGLRLALYALVLFLSAGTWRWPWGWAMLGLMAAVVAAHPLILLATHPALLAERNRGAWEPGVKGWDRWITTLAGGLMFVPWIVAGLDWRLGWSAPLPLGVHLSGLWVATLGYALFLWAMAANAFFSFGARIQAERGHAVAAGGPYRWVRHPGYAGTILAQAGIPLLLGSPWAFLPCALTALLFVARTALEDRTLRAELPGYAEYARRTRFRLLPGVW
jgi:protein-S-isoprenylcysteine O-methyltransferase Ste14